MRNYRAFAAAAALWSFLLGIREGRLALWQEGCPRPEQVYDIRADSLPPADRLILKRGLRLEDREAVWEVLENYLE